MLLYPTFNLSLMASSNEGAPMLEVVREGLSTKIFIYELVGNSFFGPNIVFGMKELSRIGVMSLIGILTPIEYNTLKGYISTGMLWNDKYLFSLTELSPEQLSSIVSSQASPASPVSGKSKGV